MQRNRSQEQSQKPNIPWRCGFRTKGPTKPANYQPPSTHTTNCATGDSGLTVDGPNMFANASYSAEMLLPFCRPTHRAFVEDIVLNGRSWIASCLESPKLCQFLARKCAITN